MNRSRGLHSLATRCCTSGSRRGSAFPTATSQGPACISADVCGLWLSRLRAPWLRQRTCGGGSRFCGFEPLLHRAGADGGEPGSSGAWEKLCAHRKLVPPAHRTTSWGFLGWALGCRMEQSAKRGRPRVAVGAFLPQSRGAQMRLPQSRVKYIGAGPLTARQVVRTTKSTTHATARHALNIFFLLFALVILHVFLLRSSSCPSTSRTSFLPVLLPAAPLFIIIFSPPTSKAVFIVCDARSHRFSSFGPFFRALPLAKRRQ